MDQVHGDKRKVAQAEPHIKSRSNTFQKEKTMSLFSIWHGCTEKGWWCHKGWPPLCCAFWLLRNDSDLQASLQILGSCPNLSYPYFLFLKNQDNPTHSIGIRIAQIRGDLCTAPKTASVSSRHKINGSYYMVIWCYNMMVATLTINIILISKMA